MDGLRAQSLEGAKMGFTGKQVIHPAQVPVVQEAFTPNDEKVKWATELIQAFEHHQKSGKVISKIKTYPTELAFLVCQLTGRFDDIII